jgi:hypothetical protein
MTKKIQIELQIPSESQSRDGAPYLEHGDFIKYCNANGVYANVEALEAYEKKGLLYPCIRVFYPDELLRRRFRASLPYSDGRYEIRDEWEPLITLENAIYYSTIWRPKEFKGVLDLGHPLDHALTGEHPFVTDPSKQKFKAWSRYKIIEGEYDGIKSRKSRAVQYYATWKIFLLDELNKLNTDEHNRATGSKRGLGWSNKRLRPSLMNEFYHFFRTTAAFSYRRYLLRINYFENTTHSEADWSEVVNKSENIAKLLFGNATYVNWIRYLRKLIDLYETFKGNNEFRLSEETKSYIRRTVVFLRHATANDFRKICKDVNGPYKKYLDIGVEDGVVVHAGCLEEMFPDKKWDLEQNVKDMLADGLKKLNSILIENEKVPDALCDQLFEELAEKPDGTALAAIRKIGKGYGDLGLWRNHEIWSGIGDLSKALEVHGKEWIGGEDLNGVLSNLFAREAPDYESLKKLTDIPKITYANTLADFLEKLTSLESASQIPVDRRCGRHLLVAHLTRNYASHQRGLTGKKLKQSFYKIYFALISTLFVIYAEYKKQ